MSVPAPKVRLPAPAPQRAPAPARTPSRPPVSRTVPSRRSRPAFHPGFLFFSTAVVTILVTGVVVLNVLLAQQAFQVRTLRGHITELQGKGVEMTDRVASLSAPGRIQMWATAHGMVTPPDVFVLPVPGAGGGGHP